MLGLTDPDDDGAGAAAPPRRRSALGDALGFVPHSNLGALRVRLSAAATLARVDKRLRARSLASHSARSSSTRAAGALALPARAALERGGARVWVLTATARGSAAASSPR